MSAFVVIVWPLYKSTISGERYDNVVYFAISSSTSFTPWVCGFRNRAVALPKSHRT